MSVATYDGPVEGVLPGDNTEILRDLLAVIDACEDKRAQLTKAGLPPKPLWAAVNARLLWSDPRSILHDWDEADQVRFIYCLAQRLRLIAPNDERTMRIGPGADRFFLTTPSRRNAMLLRAYIDISDWDERCDARDGEGHRLNFGKTFRRDFAMDAEDVRQELIAALATLPVGEWMRSDALAVAVTERAPAILISEEDEPPLLEDGEADPEIQRLVDYWLYQAARFGWVDLARTPEVDIHSSAERLFRVNAEGVKTLTEPVRGNRDTELAAALETRPFLLQPNNVIAYYREEGTIGDEYLLRRVADAGDDFDWHQPVITVPVTPDSFRDAVDVGLDVITFESRVFERAKKKVPSVFKQLLSDNQRKRSAVSISTGFVAVELNGDKKVIRKLKKADFRVFGDVALIAFDLWDEFAEVLGFEPVEGFQYPAELPLGAIEDGELQLEWSALPIAARELLEALKLKGDPPAAELSEESVHDLAADGWTHSAIAEAVLPITGVAIPRWLASARTG